MLVIVEMTTTHFLAKLSSLWVIDGPLKILLFYFKKKGPILRNNVQSNLH